MKKIYFFLAAVLAIVGIGVTHALVATVSDYVEDDQFEAGLEVVIGNNITNNNGVLDENQGIYTHTFGNYKLLFDNQNESNVVATLSGVSSFDNAVPSWVWKLVASDKAGWYYLQNGETGKYLSYTLNNQDPTNLESLPEMAKVGKKDLWWKEGEGDEAWANCKIPLQMVSDVKQAKAFKFMRPIDVIEDGVIRAGGLNEAAEDLMYNITDDSWMLIAEVGHGMFAAVNIAYNGALSRYQDWASYQRVLAAAVVDDPMEELARYMKAVSTKSYELGDYPGCVEQKEAAENYNKRMAEIMEAIDYPDKYTEDQWREMLADAKALVKQASEFTFKPVTPGYYRFISSYGEFENQQGEKKAMYSTRTGAKWAGLDLGSEEMREDTIPGQDFETDPEDYEIVEVPTGRILGLDQIWEVTEKDGNLYVQNVKTKKYFKNATNQSAAVEMADAPQWVKFVALGAHADFNLRVENKGYALHCGGHSSGAGVSGNIVPWDGGSGSCSAWKVMPVSKDEIDEIWGEDAIDQAAIEAMYYDVLDKAKAIVEVAQNSDQPTCDIVDPIIDRENKIFSVEDKGSVVTSPCSDSQEGDITYLLDGIIGDANNFWHSDWHNEYQGTWCNGYHYVEFNLQKEYQKLAMYYVPRVRPAGNGNTFEGWPEEFTIYYTNTPDDESSWKRGVSFGEGEIDADLHELRENYLPFYIGQAAQYVRIVCTKGFSWRNGHKFWMAGELNFCTYEADVIYDDGTDLFEKANKQGDDCGNKLVAAIAHADEVVATYAITKAEYDALKAAYDAFIANFTDFNKLKELIAEARAQLKSISAGTEPGQKPETAWTALNAVKDEVNSWQAKNKPTCTVADLAAQEKKLQDALDAWYAVPIYTFDTNTWYYLAFASDRSSSTKDADNVEQNEYYPSGTQLKGSHLAAMYGDSEVTFGGAQTSYATAVPTDMFEEVDDEMTQWRFVAIDDSTYAIQNRATGNFLPAADKTNYQANASLSPFPGKYFVNHLGDGTFELATVCGKNTAGQGVKTYVNQYGNTKMGFYHISGASDAGAKWLIRKAGEIESGYKALVTIGLNDMNVRGLTLPYEISDLQGDASVFTKVTAIDNEQKAIALEAAYGNVPAGTPCLIYSPDNEGIDQLIVTMGQMNWEEVKNAGVLRGTMSVNDTIQAGCAVPAMLENGNKFYDKTWGAVAVVDEATHMAAGSAWIDPEFAEEGLFKALADDDDFLLIDTENGELEDGIAIVKGNNGKLNVIYNLNGQRLSAPVKGIMIINGKKVVLK